MRILELLMRETLPQRNYFRASEVSDLLMIKPHEMRYWETEFPQIRPQKTKTGQRIYRRQDVIIFSAIKHLLLEKKISLPAAQRIIAESDDLFSTPAPSMHDDSALDTELLNAQAPTQVYETECDDAQLLQEAASILEHEESEFDNVAQQIYEACADELVHAVPVETCVPVMPVLEPVDVDTKMSRQAYEQTLATLKESKTSLTEILTMLDKYHESNFWQAFKY